MRLIDSTILKRRLYGLIYELLPTQSDDYIKSEIKRFTVDTINDCIKMVDEQPTINQWIPVSERLPERWTQVLCCNTRGNVFTSCQTGLCYLGSHQYPVFGKHTNVIAWMPLPEPYKEKNNDANV